MKDATMLKALVEDVREQYYRNVEILADEYVEVAYTLIKKILKEHPEKSEMKEIAIPIKKVDFVACTIELSPEYLFEYCEREYTKVMETDDALFGTNPDDEYSLLPNNIKKFIDALEKRGFRVYTYPAYDDELRLYPFFQTY